MKYVKIISVYSINDEVLMQFLSARMSIFYTVEWPDAKTECVQNEIYLILCIQCIMQGCTTVSISKVTLYLYTDFTQNDWLYHQCLTMEEWHILHAYAEYCIMLGMILALHEYARKDTVFMLSVRLKGHVEVKKKI